MSLAPERSRRARRPESSTSRWWSSTRLGQSGASERSSGVSAAGCRYTSVTPGRRSNEHLLDGRPAADAVGHVDEVVGEHHALLGRELAEREADQPLARRARQAQRQAEVDGQLEVDVEELGPQLQRAHVAVEVAHVEAPEDGPLDLGPALAADLVDVGVVPHVGLRCGGSRRRRRAATAPCVIGPQR